MIDFINKWGGERTGLRKLQIVGWVGIARSKFYDWQVRYGKANEHNSWIPRDHWIEGWERDRIVEFAREHPLDGYRRLTLMPPPPGSGPLRAAWQSVSGLPSPSAHDAGWGCRGRQSINDLPGSRHGGASAKMERQTIEEGHGL